MITVIIPIAILIILIFVKKIPVVKGNIALALIISGLIALLLGGMYSPIDWGKAWVGGIDKLAWIMALALFGSIYAETQTQMKTLDLVIQVLRGWFGKSPKGMIAVIIVALGVAGSLLGDAIASATVIGILVVGILAEMQLSGEEIAATITMGGILGSIMPPITQAIFLSSSLTGVDPKKPVNITYITIGIALVVCIIYAAFKFIRIKTLPEELLPTQTTREIMKGNWGRMVPLISLIIMVILYAAADINIGQILLGPVLKVLAEIPIIRGLSNSIVVFLILATVIAMFFPAVRKNTGKVFVKGFTNAFESLKIQIGAAFLIGSFYFAGQIEAVKEFAGSLAPNMIKIGGACSEILIGALTGSQSTAQNAIFSFFSPALVEIGVSPVHTAVAGAHIASGAQALPPASLTALVVCGLVGGIIHKEVNPIKTMILCLPMSIYLIGIGILFMYI